MLVVMINDCNHIYYHGPSLLNFLFVEILNFQGKASLLQRLEDVMQTYSNTSSDLSDDYWALICDYPKHISLRLESIMDCCRENSRDPSESMVY